MRRLSYLGALFIVALLMVIPAAGARPGHDVTVSIKNFAFNPSNITVAPGTTVTWLNNDSVPHTTTSDNGMWDSETLQPGQSFSVRFDTPGTFSYHCEIHPFMKGSVIVRKGGTVVPHAQAIAGQTMALAGGS